MTAAAALEAYYARLLTDAAARARFAAAPMAEAQRAGLDAEGCTQIAALDLAALERAADSFAHKRGQRRRRPGWFEYAAKKVATFFRPG